MSAHTQEETAQICNLTAVGQIVPHDLAEAGGDGARLRQRRQHDLAGQFVFAYLGEVCLCRSLDRVIVALLELAGRRGLLGHLLRGPADAAVFDAGGYAELFRPAVLGP